MVTWLTRETDFMSWFGVLFASIGAAAILGALAFVSTLLGIVITSMVVLMCGPLIDRFLARRNRRSV
jgi:membrane protein implicated in regulation of membrane protease activity